MISRARKDLEKSALPFPITGLTLVPKECLSTVEDCLLKRQEEFWHEVGQFEQTYEQARQSARQSLGDLFNELDYPRSIRRKFGFDWQYLTIETPGKYQILTPEIYERERVKFETMMEETRQIAVGIP